MAFGEHETFDHPVACAAPPIYHASCRALYAMSVCTFMEEQRCPGHNGGCITGEVPTREIAYNSAG